MSPADVALCAYQLARATGSAEAYEAAAHAMARAIQCNAIHAAPPFAKRPAGRPMLIVDNTRARAA